MTFSTIILIIFWIPILLYTASSLFFYVGLHRRTGGKNTRKHFVSVIIAARNEEKQIPELLDSLKTQDYPQDRFEVIVIDDKSTDHTADIIRDFSREWEQLRLLQVSETPGNYSPKKYALTRGINAAKGEIILGVDADCTVQPTWISTMNSYFAEEVGMVVGFSSVTVEDPSSWIQRWQAFDFLALMAANEGALNRGVPLAASGQNMGFRKEAFEMVGGYDSIADRATGDDVLLLQLIRRQTDFSIVFAGSPKAYNTTVPERTLKSLLHQRIRWASDAPVQLAMDPGFFAYLFSVFTMYLVVLGGIVFSFFYPSFLPVLVAGYLVKAGGEFVLLRYAVTLYDRRELLREFPWWTLLQIPYIIVAGVGGAFFNYSWKGRTRKEANHLQNPRGG